MPSLSCPACGVASNRVVDSRVGAAGGAVWRRRQCENCRERFTTYEFAYTAERRRQFEPSRVSLDATPRSGGSFHDLVGDGYWEDPTFDEVLSRLEGE